jgi:hypothetical protein
MIEMRIKSVFFDRPKVIKAVDRAKRQALSKGGAFIRQAAKTGIRPRKGTSKPGSPPFSHEGSLRRLILFAYDERTDSVVVGPVGFRKSTAPNVLEFGGTTTIFRRRGGRFVREQVRIAARSYMAPALERERPKLPALWRNSVRGG